MDSIDTRPTTSRLEVPVVVVGAGPAGLVTAIELARHGVRALVVERHPSTSIFPRATGVSTRSMEIFRGWGIDDEVRQGGWNVIARQATVARLDDPEPRIEPLGFPEEAESLAVSPTSAAVSPQDHLEPVLVRNLRSLGGAVRFSTELVSFETHAAGVDLVLRDRTNAATTTVRAGWLVGADGHRSTVRDGAGIVLRGPDDLGRYLSILFRADLRAVLGETVFGLYMIEGAGGPPTVLVPSGADDRFVLGVPLAPDMTDAAVEATFSTERAIGMIRAAAGRPALPVEILATSSFAFAAQTADRLRAGRVLLVGDAAHRMTPRGGRGMNTAIADGVDLGWKLAWTIRGLGGPALLDTYETERGPLGRRNVALSLASAGGGSADGLLEDLGTVVHSDVIVGEGSDPGLVAARLDAAPAAAALADAAPVDPAGSYVPDARPGARAPHVWLRLGERRLSTLDLFGRGLVLVTAGMGATWRAATRERGRVDPVGAIDVRIRPIGDRLVDDGTFLATYGLQPGGAVLVRPDGIVAWRSRELPADPAAALSAAVAIATGHGTDTDRAVLAVPTVASAPMATRAA